MCHGIHHCFHSHQSDIQNVPPFQSQLWVMWDRNQSLSPRQAKYCNQVTLFYFSSKREPVIGWLLPYWAKDGLRQEWVKGAWNVLPFWMRLFLLSDIRLVASDHWLASRALTKVFLLCPLFTWCFHGDTRPEASYSAIVLTSLLSLHFWKMVLPDIQFLVNNSFSTKKCYPFAFSLDCFKFLCF